MSATKNQPIFIIGCPRSGTTLLRRLFDAHSQISCPGESFVLRGAARFLASERVAEGIDYGPLGALSSLGFGRDEITDRLGRMVLSFHEDIAKAEDKPRAALKTAVDSFYLPEIHDIFGDQAKYLCLVRHGADVAMSLRDFSEKMEGFIDELLPFVQSHRRLLPAFGAAWAKVTADMLDLAEAFGDHVFAFHYEDLVAEPREVLQELFDFVEAPCDIDNLLADAFRPKEVRGLGDYKTFTTTGIETSSVGRWEGLPDRIKAELAPILNPTLARAGYAEIETHWSGTDDGMRRHELAMMYQASRRPEGGDDR